MKNIIVPPDFSKTGNDMFIGLYSGSKLKSEEPIIHTLSAAINNETNERIEAIAALSEEIQTVNSTTSNLASKLIETAVSLASEAVQNNIILEAEIEDLKQQVATLAETIESMRNQ